MSDHKEHVIPDQYEVYSDKGTELKFSHKYNKTKDRDSYRCVLCSKRGAHIVRVFDDSQNLTDFRYRISSLSLSLVRGTTYER